LDYQNTNSDKDQISFSP